MKFISFTDTNMNVLENSKYSLKMMITEDPDLKVYENINMKVWGSLKLPPRWVDRAKVDVVDSEIENLLLPEAKVKAKKIIHPENFEKQDEYYVYKKDVEDYTKPYFDCVSLIGHFNTLYGKNYAYVFRKYGIDVRFNDRSKECIKILILESNDIKQEDTTVADIVDTKTLLLVPNKPVLIHTPFHSSQFPHYNIPLMEATDPQIQNARKEYPICTSPLDIGVNNEKVIKKVFKDYVKIGITNISEIYDEMTKCEKFVTAPFTTHDLPSFHLRLPISASVPLLTLTYNYTSYEARAYLYEEKKKNYKPQPNIIFSVLYIASLNALVKGDMLLVHKMH